MDLYLDAEWYINQNIFLLGWAYGSVNPRKNPVAAGQLYGTALNKASLERLLNRTKGYVYCYGPDIGMIEKHFEMNIRENYECINLLKIFRRALPGRSSYKLADFEDDYGIRRHEDKYKRSIFRIWDDWNNSYYRLRVLKYNVDDVRNLVKLKDRIFQEQGITNKMLRPHILKNTKKKN